MAHDIETYAATSLIVGSRDCHGCVFPTPPFGNR